MPVSKFLLSGNIFFRSNTHHTVLSPVPQFLASKPFPFKSLQFQRRFCSSSPALSTVTSDYTETLNSPIEAQKQFHPWPEWVSFVDRLKTKGYFPATSNADDAIAGNVYKDMNQLKDPCLSFARDRYDLFKSLSASDIRDVVDCGCPNLLRKAVNSAKRLRSYLRLDEGEVCGACNLRGSCDRAYVLLIDEAGARTVDIVRLLLFYALDPLVISGEQKPPGREVVEASVRKLLSELIELSETTPDPPIQRPAVKTTPKKDQDRKSFGSKWTSQSDVSVNDKLSRDVEMKRGDWMCPKCNFMNFSKNIRCLKCSEEGPKKVGDTDMEMKKGDWICSKCEFMNFSRNIRCLKCKEEGPKRVGTDEVQMKKGDWNCSKCGFMNFASNKMCLRCQELRPKRQLSRGEWECPSCDFLNYARNEACLKCKGDRPKRPASEYEESMWRSPH